MFTMKICHNMQYEVMACLVHRIMKRALITESRLLYCSWSLSIISLDDLAATLIHEKGTDGAILYEARQSFNLNPRQFKGLVAKAKRAIEEEIDQRPKPVLSTSSSWSYLNGLGNLVFARSFAIPKEKIHLSPIQARKRLVYRLTWW